MNVKLLVEEESKSEGKVIKNLFVFIGYIRIYSLSLEVFSRNVNFFDKVRVFIKSFRFILLFIGNVVMYLFLLRLGFDFSIFFFGILFLIISIKVYFVGGERKNLLSFF